LKLFLNVTTYLVTAFATILAFFSFAEVYQDLSDNGNYYFLLDIIIWLPITLIVSLIGCYFLIKKITIKPILFGTIISFWLIKIIPIVKYSYTSYQYKLHEDYIQNFFDRHTIDLCNLLMPTLLVLVSHFLFKKYNNWLHIGGFTLGASFGFFTSYAIVLFRRLVHNSLTSYHYFDNNELMIVIVGTAIFTILGSIIGLKKFNQTQGV